MGQNVARGGERLALLCPPLAGGGAERVMITLASAFADRGHVVDLLVAGDDVTPGDRERYGISKFVNLNPWFFRHTICGVPALLYYLREARPRAVLSTLIELNAMNVAAAHVVPRAWRPRVVVREANTLPTELRFRPRATRALSRWTVRASYPRADAIVAVSEQAGDDLSHFLDLPRERITTIRNPSVTAGMLARASDAVEHAWFDARREVPVIVAAGRLVEKKGFLLLLAAFQRVRCARAARLYIMGEGPQRAAIEAYLACAGLGDDVELAGFVGNPFARYARADLFVLSSFAEGMPNALIEAMACGCPVVATDCPSGPREITHGGRHGRLVPVGDVGALATAMLETLRAPPRRVDMHRRASAYHIDAVIGEYAQVLHLASALQPKSVSGMSHL